MCFATVISCCDTSQEIPSSVCGHRRAHFAAQLLGSGRVSRFDAGGMARDRRRDPWTWNPDSDVDNGLLSLQRSLTPSDGRISSPRHSRYSIVIVYYHSVLLLDAVVFFTLVVNSADCTDAREANPSGARTAGLIARLCFPNISDPNLHCWANRILEILYSIKVPRVAVRNRTIASFVWIAE